MWMRSEKNEIHINITGFQFSVTTENWASCHDMQRFLFPCAPSAQGRCVSYCPLSCVCALWSWNCCQQEGRGQSADSQVRNRNTHWLGTPLAVRTCLYVGSPQKSLFENTPKEQDKTNWTLCWRPGHQLCVCVCVCVFGLRTLYCCGVFLIGGVFLFVCLDINFLWNNFL